MMDKGYKPPISPVINGILDTSNFDESSRNVRETP